MGWPVSDAFAAAVRHSHRAVVRCEVWSGLTVLAALEVTDGEVVEDQRRAVRRTCNLTLTDPLGTLVPDSVGDLLTPLSNEIRPYRGIRLADGTDELVPLGVFVLTDTVITDNGALTIALTGSDRAQRIIDATLTDLLFIPAGQTVAQAISTILVDRWPACPPLQVQLGTAPTLTAAVTLDSGANAWTAAQKIATDYGLELFFDALGAPLLRVIVDPATVASSGVYTDGQEAVLLDARRGLTRTDTYSGVVLTAESTQGSAAYRSVVWDLDPNSPTYAYGPFGKKPYLQASSNITNQSQADATAAGLLSRKRGTSESLEWTQIVDPSRQAGDVLTISRPRLKVASNVVLDSVTTPLRPESTQRAVAGVRTIWTS